MLVITADKRVADIYLGEFMRLFSHFRRRGLAASARSTTKRNQFLFLCPDDSWIKPFYVHGSAKMKERRLFG